MPVYFGFLDGALHALLDSLDGLEALLAQAVEKRDTYRLSRTIDSAHLATERLLKHVVAEVDPYLLLMSPNHEMLKVLRKAVVHRDTPTIFSSSARFDTVKPSALAKLVPDVTHPTIDPTLYGPFENAFTAVTSLRNMVQHGELYGDSDELLAAVKRLLAELLPVMQAISPDGLEKLRGIRGQAESRLKALKVELDGSWVVLTDYLKAERTVTIESKLYLTTPPEGNALTLVIAPKVVGTNAISAFFSLPASAAVGFFGRALSKSELETRQRLRSLERGVPSVLQALWLGSSSQSPVANSHNLGLGAALSQSAVATPTAPLWPLEAGNMLVDVAPASLSLHLEGIKNSEYLNVSIALVKLHAQFAPTETRGSIDGLLLPAVRAGISPALPIRMSGGIDMTGEYFVEEPDEKLSMVAGSTWRVFESTITLTWDAKGAA